jgi:hypothetical protein
MTGVNPVSTRDDAGVRMKKLEMVIYPTFRRRVDGKKDFQ